MTMELTNKGWTILWIAIVTVCPLSGYGLGWLVTS